MEFTITIVANPCLFATINAFPVSDMDFRITHDKTPTEHFFTPFTDTVGSCGPIAYSLTGNWPVLVDYPDELVILDSIAASLTLFTDNGLHVGTYTAVLSASLQDYPSLTATIGV